MKQQRTQRKKILAGILANKIHNISKAYKQAVYGHLMAGETGLEPAACGFGDEGSAFYPVLSDTFRCREVRRHGTLS